MNKNVLILSITLIIIFISLLIPNPFFANCNIFGCVYGQGWPLPFYYRQYCTMGDVGCKENYVSISRLSIDIVSIFVILFLIMLIFRKIKK